MNKKILFFIAMLYTCFSNAQQNSTYDYIKVWNFIKYYHPDVASGKIDADSLFIAHVLVPDLDMNTSVKLLTQDLNNHFTEKAVPNQQTDVLNNNKDFSWFQDNKALQHKYQKLLQNIYEYRYVGVHYYDVSQTQYEGEIPHEKAYEFDSETQMPLEYRLLAMAKMIGTIDYLYLYKYLMPENATETLQQLVIQSSTCTSRKEFEVLLAQTAALFEDSHAFGFFRKLHFKKDIYHTQYYSPFNYQVLDDYILVTELIFPEVCKKANIAVGDRIVAVNGVLVKEMIAAKKSLLSFSNHHVALHFLSNYVSNLIWMDDEQSKAITLQKYQSHQQMNTTLELIALDEQTTAKINSYIQQQYKEDETYKLVDTSIAYFRTDQSISFIEHTPDDQLIATMDSVFADAANKKAIVFDMRAYPDNAGFLHTFVYNYFADKVNLHSKFYRENLNDFGTFVYVSQGDPIVGYYPEIEKGLKHPYHGKVFIIVNSDTQSLSEWDVMNLQHIFPQAVTIGEQTAGADGDVKYMTLPGGYVFGFTGHGIFYPDNTLTQKVGVRIDTKIEYTDDDILNHVDIPFNIILKEVETR